MRHAVITIKVAYDDTSDMGPDEIKYALEYQVLRFVSHGGLAPSDTDLVVEDYSTRVEVG